jgi:hypothetical protein
MRNRRVAFRGFDIDHRHATRSQPPLSSARDSPIAGDAAAMLPSDVGHFPFIRRQDIPSGRLALPGTSPESAPLEGDGHSPEFDSTWVSDQAVAELQAAIPGLAVSRVGRPSW